MYSTNVRSNYCQCLSFNLSRIHLSLYPSRVYLSLYSSRLYIFYLLGYIYVSIFLGHIYLSFRIYRISVFPRYIYLSFIPWLLNRCLIKKFYIFLKCTHLWQDFHPALLLAISWSQFKKLLFVPRQISNILYLWLLSYFADFHKKKIALFQKDWIE